MSNDEVETESVGNRLTELVNYFNKRGLNERALGVICAMYVASNSDEDRRKILSMYLAVYMEDNRLKQSVLDYLKIENTKIKEAFDYLTELSKFNQTGSATKTRN